MAQNPAYIVPQRGFGYPNSPLLFPTIGDTVQYRSWSNHIVIALSRLQPDNPYYDKDDPYIGIQHPSMAGRKGGTVFLPLRLIRFVGRRQAVVRVRKNEVEARLKREQEEQERIQKMSQLYAQRVRTNPAPVARVRSAPVLQPVATTTTPTRIRTIHVPGH